MAECLKDVGKAFVAEFTLEVMGREKDSSYAHGFLGLVDPGAQAIRARDRRVIFGTEQRGHGLVHCLAQLMQLEPECGT
jgi:hypothetical protein